MAQGKQVMSMESRIDRVEAEQDYLRESLDKLITSQEKQTSEMRENTAAMMVMCHKLDSSTEIGKKALDKVDANSTRLTKLETKDCERMRTEKQNFIGMLIISAGSVAAILKAFGVI